MVSLVLGSLSNVIGYQSMKSTMVNNSPLFCIQTQKAIKKDSTGILKSGYLGKGTHTIHIPVPENKTLLYQNVIDRIRSMDDTTFSHFLVEILQMKNQNAQLRNTDETTIITGLHQLRIQDIDIKQYQDSFTNHFLPQNARGNSTVFIIQSSCWYPGRLILLCIEFILAWSTLLLLIIYCTLAYPDCNPPTSMTMCCH